MTHTEMKNVFFHEQCVEFSKKFAKQKPQGWRTASESTGSETPLSSIWTCVPSCPAHPREYQWSIHFLLPFRTQAAPSVCDKTVQKHVSAVLVRKRKQLFLSWKIKRPSQTCEVRTRAPRRDGIDLGRVALLSRSMTGWAREPYKS